MAAPSPRAALIEAKPYPGSKGQSGTAQRIIGQMPPHSVYVEPFAGSARVFKAKRPAESSILIDSNRSTIAALGDAAGVRAIVGDALKLLPELFAWLPPDAVVYCDPPYLLGTRQGRLYYGAHVLNELEAAIVQRHGRRSRPLADLATLPLALASIAGPSASRGVVDRAEPLDLGTPVAVPCPDATPRRQNQNGTATCHVTAAR